MFYTPQPIAFAFSGISGVGLGHWVTWVVGLVPYDEFTMPGGVHMVSPNNPKKLDSMIVDRYYVIVQYMIIYDRHILPLCSSHSFSINCEETTHWQIHWYRWSGGSSMASRFTLSTLLRCLYLSKAKDPPAAFASNIIESWLQDTAKTKRSSKTFGLFGLVRNLTNDQLPSLDISWYQLSNFNCLWWRWRRQRLLPRWSNLWTKLTSGRGTQLCPKNASWKVS